MPFLFNENSRAGVPIAYQFAYAGISVDWGSTRIMGMSDVSVRAEPLDGKFSVSELRTTFADTDGSLWGSLGHGTSCLGSSWSATVLIGGTMSEAPFGAGETRLARLNTQASGTYVIHKGRVTDVSRRNRLVEITSKSHMAQVADLEWTFPVRVDQYAYNSRYGTQFFINQTLTDTGSCFFNFGDDLTSFDVYAYVGPEVASNIEAFYPTPANRGTMGRVLGCCYPGTQFYLDYDRYLFAGSNLGTKIGTINDDDGAKKYGYADIGEAQAAKTSPTGLATYIINKTRFTLKGDEPKFSKGSNFNWQQAGITLEETPAVLWREMLTGCGVTPLYGSSTDLDTAAYATAASVTAFQTFRQKIDPKGGKVLPYLKNLMEPLSALFSVDTQNKFRIHCYGPKNYTDVIGTITGSSIIDSSVSSSMDDKFNRVVLNYGYDFETGSFSRSLEVTGTGWAHSNDFVLELDSKWLQNSNDAQITTERIVRRFYQGVPKLALEVPLSQAGADVGSLFAVEDSDLGYSSRVFEVVGWKKNFTDDRKVTLEMWDGDALYKQRGFGRWDDGVTMTNVVNSDSTFGWGASGTVLYINSDFYGPIWNWF